MDDTKLALLDRLSAAVSASVELTSPQVTNAAALSPRIEALVARVQQARREVRSARAALEQHRNTHR